MQVTEISDRQQEFLGEVYWKCGKYFQRYGKRLHRVVYEHCHGGIQKGYHVHHIDGDRTNNQPENLKLMRCGRHTSHHQKGHKRGAPSAATNAAKAWHSSEDGRKWHKEHYALTAKKLHEERDFICEYCGAGYRAEVTGRNRFCSNNCKTQARMVSGVDDETRQCSVCGNEFSVNKYSRTQACTRSCSRKLSERKRQRAV